MNYLAHHVVARRAEPGGSPEFFVGNLLPDLMAVSGDGRLRVAHLAGQTGDLARGARLHMETDRSFHGSPAFAEASAGAKKALLAGTFSAPLHRVFFLAHVMVEIALDALLLENGPAPADDLYAQIAACDRAAISREVTRLTGRTATGLGDTLDWFGTHRYLYSYAEPEGQAEALYRLARRVGLVAFEKPADRDQLAHVFGKFTTELRHWEKALLSGVLEPGFMVQ